MAERGGDGEFLSCPVLVRGRGTPYPVLAEGRGAYYYPGTSPQPLQIFDRGTPSPPPPPRPGQDRGTPFPPPDRIRDRT